MIAASQSPNLTTYEARLARSFLDGVGEAALMFENKGEVRKSLRDVTRRLDGAGVSYAVVGAMALFAHGMRRFTEDVDLLVTADGLRSVHEGLEGRGYVPPFVGSKQLRDTSNGVRIEFLVSGAFPGDGKPKPVAFPDPAEPGVTVEIDGVRVIALEKLIELKLASGMTAPHRMKDLADVQALIEARKLPAEFADRLHPYVRAKFAEMWGYATGPRPDFEERDPNA